MKKNMDTIDKTIRILVAVAIAVLFFAKVITGTVGIVLLVLPIVFVLKGKNAIQFQPLYWL
ncbi:MAG: DUF2892 domain-containing protein [Mariniphaga sp.]